MKLERDKIAAFNVNEDFCHESSENQGKKDNCKQIKNNLNPFGEL